MRVVGRSDRRLQRALQALERTYAGHLRPHRLVLGELAAEDRVDELAVIHRDAAASAWRAADREGGAGWVARSGSTIVEHADRLWDEHGEPLTGVSALRLRDA